jgi:hypothetical protein
MPSSFRIVYYPYGESLVAGVVQNYYGVLPDPCNFHLRLAGSGRIVFTARAWLGSRDLRSIVSSLRTLGLPYLTY